MLFGSQIESASFSGSALIMAPRTLGLNSSIILTRDGSTVIYPIQFDVSLYALNEREKPANGNGNILTQFSSARTITF